MKRGRRINNIPQEQKKAEKLYLKGYPKDEIASIIGISLMTLYRWAEKYGWDKAYKQKYDLEISKIEDSIEKVTYALFHRTPKIPTPEIVKNSEP